jgi:hypothetical protein
MFRFLLYVEQMKSVRGDLRAQRKYLNALMTPVENFLNTVFLI